MKIKVRYSDHIYVAIIKRKYVQLFMDDGLIGYGPWKNGYVLWDNEKYLDWRLLDSVDKGIRRGLELMKKKKAIPREFAVELTISSNAQL